MLLPSLHSEGAWPAVDVVVIWNLILDGAAVIPQVLLVSVVAGNDAKGNEKSKAKSTNFLGLLCLGRVFRMLFWLVVKMADPTHNVALWTFVLPDLLHSVIMADYLWVWVQKIKEEHIEPAFEGIMAL